MPGLEERIAIDLNGNVFLGVPQEFVSTVDGLLLLGGDGVSVVAVTLSPVVTLQFPIFDQFPQVGGALPGSGFGRHFSPKGFIDPFYDSKPSKQRK
jgi:hypothetical protein